MLDVREVEGVQLFKLKNPWAHLRSEDAHILKLIRVSGGEEIGQSWIQHTGLLPSDKHSTIILTMLQTLTMVME